jgi:hypothetical protein
MRPQKETASSFGWRGVAAYQDGGIFRTRNVPTTICRTSKPRLHFLRLFPILMSPDKVVVSDVALELVTCTQLFPYGVSILMYLEHFVVFFFHTENTEMTWVYLMLIIAYCLVNFGDAIVCVKRDRNCTNICSSLVSKQQIPRNKLTSLSERSVFEFGNSSFKSSPPETHYSDIYCGLP